MEKFLRPVQLKAFFYDKEDDSNTSEKDIFQIFQTRKSWTPPVSRWRLFRFIINVVMTSVNLISTVTPNFPTFRRKRGRHKKILLRAETIVKAADKGGTGFGCLAGRPLPKKKLCGNFLTPLSMLKSISLPLTSKLSRVLLRSYSETRIASRLRSATNLIITTPRNSCIYLLPKIHRSQVDLLTYLDKIMAPVVRLYRHMLKIVNTHLFFIQNYGTCSRGVARIFP